VLEGFVLHVAFEIAQCLAEVAGDRTGDLGRTPDTRVVARRQDLRHALLGFRLRRRVVRLYLCLWSLRALGYRWGRVSTLRGISLRERHGVIGLGRPLGRLRAAILIREIDVRLRLRRLHVDLGLHEDEALIGAVELLPT